MKTGGYKIHIHDVGETCMSFTHDIIYRLNHTCMCPHVCVCVCVCTVHVRARGKEGA